MPQNKYTKKIEELEKSGKFDEDIKPVNPHFVKEMNPDKFKYSRKNIFWKLYSFIVRLIVYILGPIVTWFCFHLKIKGKKNLRAIKKKGAVVVSNHVHAIDALYIKQICRTRSTYFLAAPFNNKKGLAGLTIRVAGLLPIGNSVKLVKQLDNTVSNLLKRKQLLAVCAEGSLWVGYKKIRPLKKGAFHYAVKNNSPIVPIVALFREPNKWDKFIHRRYKITVQILPVIFPKDELSFGENIKYMQESCHQAMIECANKHYGKESDAEKYIEIEENQELEDNSEI